MKKLLLILILAFGYFIPSIFCASVCIVTDASPIGNDTGMFQIRVGEPSPIPEDQVGFKIWESSLTSPMTPQPPDDPLANVIQFHSDAEFVIVTTSEFENIVDDMGDDGKLLSITQSFMCDEDNEILIFYITIHVQPVISQPPEFSVPLLNIALTTPWNPEVPLNYREVVTVTDADYGVGHNFTLEISNSNFTFTFDNNTNQLSIFSKFSQFPEDEISFSITANDGIYSASLPVTITVTGKDNLFPPKFEESYYYVDEQKPDDLLFITEILANDPEFPDKQNSIEYSVPVEFQPTIQIENGNRVYFRNAISVQFPYIFEITATEKVETNPLSTNVAVIVDFPLDPVVFSSAMYTYKNIGISLKENENIGEFTPAIPGAQITLESQYFGIRDDYQIFVKQNLEEEDIFNDENPNGVHLGTLKSGKQQATLLIYFDPTLRTPATTPACSATTESCDCENECTTSTAVTDPCPSTAVTCECENECTTVVTNQSDCSSTPSTLETCPSPTPCDCSTSTDTTLKSDCSSTPSSLETCPSPLPCDCSTSTDTTITPGDCPPPIPCDNDCTTTPPDSECKPPDTCDDCDSGSNTGLVAGIAVISVIAAGAIGAAVFFYLKSTKLSRDTTSSYNSNTILDDFGEENAQKAASGFNNPIFANTSSFVTSSDKTPLVKDSKLNDTRENLSRTVPTSSTFVGSSSNSKPPSAVAFSSSNNGIGNNAVKSTASEYGTNNNNNQDTLKSNLAQPKEIPADYEGAVETKPDNSAPKKEKKILFVGEQVFPIEKNAKDTSNTKDELEPPPMSDSETDDTLDEKL